MFKELFARKTSAKSRIILLVKMVIAFTLGILLAEILGLRYEYTTGVIAVLSLEPTRKRSIRSAILRILDSVLALGIASGLFALLGFDFWVLIIFISVLVPLTFLFRLEGGLVVALVLVSQVYLEKDIMFALNALGVLGVSLTLAFLLNLYMPKHDRSIERSITTIDRGIDQAIQTIASGKQADFGIIRNLLTQARETLLLDIENHYLMQTDRRAHYLELRQEQVAILEKVDASLPLIPDIPEKLKILDFLKTFKGKIGKADFASELKTSLDGLFAYFKGVPLPETRESFEARAQLFHMLWEFETVLQLKIAFHRQFPGP